MATPEHTPLRLAHPSDQWLTELRTIAAQLTGYAPSVREHDQRTGEAMDTAALLLDQLVLRVILAQD